MSARGAPVIALHTGRRIRVWGPRSDELARLLDTHHRNGGFSVSESRTDDLDAAAQYLRIGIVNRTRRSA